MAAPQSLANQVWIGNIPYEATEEALKEVFSSAGNIVSVRIRYDKDSGQSKGFAFCEYDDPDSCTLAVKHLNGTLFGGRTLRVDFCSNEPAKPLMFGEALEGAASSNKRPLLSTSFGNEPTYRGGENVKRYSTNAAAENLHDYRVQTCRIVEELTITQLFYILGHMQHLVVQNPEAASRLLRENVSLCYAIIHALFICGMITERPDNLTFCNDELLECIYNDNQRREKQLQKALKFHERNTLELTQKLSDLNEKQQQQQHQVEPVCYQKRNEVQSYTSPNTSQNIEDIQTTQSRLPEIVTQTDEQYHHEQLNFSNSSSVPIPISNDFHQQYSTQSLPLQQHQEASSSIIDHILSQPALLQQIASLTPKQEALLSNSERANILFLQQVKLLHTFFCLLKLN